MKNKKNINPIKNIIKVLIMTSLSLTNSYLMCGDKRYTEIEINMVQEKEQIIKTGNILFKMTTTMPIKKFRLKKEAMLVYGKFWGRGLYIERPSAMIYTSASDYIDRIEYDKNPELYPEKDILEKVLPIGTEFELMKIELDDFHMSGCHYYIKLLTEPKYSNELVEAVAITYIGGDIGTTWNSDWEARFINWDKKKIIANKVPLFLKKWAEEIKG
jgi:hypothetical protein